MGRTLYQVDAFTSEKFKGNPAGVVLNAEGLSETEMQAIARELNNSETAFIFPARGKDHDLEVRFFTPTLEVPMCGHNTIALHYVRAMEGLSKAGVQIQKTKAGLIPVEIIVHENDFRISMTQNSPVFDSFLPLEYWEPLLRATGLKPGDLDVRCPILIVSTGSRKALVGLKSRASLNALSPDFRTLKELGSTFNCTGYYFFTLDSPSADVTTYGRMFGPQVGIDEDPVTGMGIGPLGAYLVKMNLVDTAKNPFSFVASQGEAMGRPGRAYVEMDRCDKVAFPGRRLIAIN